MERKSLSAFLVLLLVCSCTGQVYVPHSPCPDLFGYFISQTYDIFGAMTLKNDLSGEYHLRVNMSIPTNTDKGLSIRRVTSDEEVQQGKGIEYYVGFPYNHTWPVMREVLFNNVTYCTGPQAQGDKVTELSITHDFKTTINQDVLDKAKAQTTQPPPKVTEKDSMPSKYTINCGETDPTLPFIKWGRPARMGEFPWLVAMFYYDSNIKQYAFRCSSTLISERYVITAAHCVKAGDAVMNKDLFALVLGKHNIRTWLKHSQIRDVKEIHVHPDYKRPADADIAVMEMTSPVEYTSTIRPVCLWNEDASVNNIFGQTGRVLGWGKDENNREFVEDARQLEMPIATNEKCLRSDVGFLTITSERTFCAGKLDGSGPCTGDSGGGFLMNRNGKWTLRGIVSLGIQDPRTRSCDSRKYTVFTDVPAFTQWILSVLK